MAKSVKKNSGLTIIAKKNVVQPKDVLGFEAYDENLNTSTSAINGKKIFISDEIWGRELYLKEYTDSSWNDLHLIFYDKSGKALGSYYYANDWKGQTTKEHILKIPINTSYLYTYCGKNHINGPALIYEIRLNTYPSINESKFYTRIKDFEIEKAYSLIDIKYDNTAINRLYKINDGDWKTYNGKFKIYKNDVIYAKFYDKNNKESLISVYNATIGTSTLGQEAFDNNLNTSTKDINKKYVSIDKSMWNKKIILKEYTDSDWNDLHLIFYDNNGTALRSYYYANDWKGQTTKEHILTVPTNTFYLYTYCGKNHINGPALIYELRPSSDPTFTQVTHYSTLTTNGFNPGYNELKINYLSNLSEKLYSLDNGNTWLNYIKPLVLAANTTVKAKGVTSEGKDTTITSYKVVDPTDTITTNAYDNDENTSISVAKNTQKIFEVTENTYNRSLRIYSKENASSTANIIFYDKDNNELLNHSLTEKVSVVEIPNNSKKAIINSGTSDLSIIEINLRDQSNVVSDNDLPEIKINDSKWSTSKSVDILYPTGDYRKEYSLDNGETWNIYDTNIILNDNAIILARVVDENEKVVSSSSMVVTKIDNVEPTIDINIPDSIEVGTEYELPTNFNVGNSGGKPICKINESIVTNTKDLTTGNYTIQCSITNGANVTKSVNKTFEVVESSEDNNTGS